MKLITISCLLLTFCSAATAARPNIIYILADDLGRGDIGCYGQKTLTTPNLDRMAAEGMRFTRHYSGSTVCAPSRCVLMTGLHTGHCRVRGNDNWIIPDTDVTVPSLLKKAGYHTACIGKFGLGKPLPDDDPQRKGFEEFFGYVGTSHAHNFYPTFLIRDGKRVAYPNVMIADTEKSAGDYAGPGQGGTGVATADGRKAWAPQLFSDDVRRYIGERAGDKARPFFLYYALTIPHTNNEARADSPLGHGMECPDYGEFKDKDWPAAEKGFATFIRFLDDEVGRIIARVKELGIDDNTLILFSSDNGAHQEGGHKSDFFDSNGELRGIKRDLYDGGIRVPLIARWPGAIKSGAVSDHLSGFQDLLPTVAELAGAKVEAETDGISLAPTLLGKPEAQQRHPFLFWDFNEQGGKRAVLQWPWKLIHLNRGAKSETGKKARPITIELYNLETDPVEEENVAAENPAIVTALEMHMSAAWREPVK